MLVSHFFRVCALSPLPLHPNGPRCNPLTDQCLRHGWKILVTTIEGNTSPRCYPRLRCNSAHRNPIVDDAQNHPSPNRSSHATRMPRPYPLHPKRNPRLAAMEGIATQSPRRHPAHMTTIGPHPIASAGPPRHLILPILRVSLAWTFRCSSTSHSTRQPRPDLAMLEYEMEDTSLSAQI
jgi:hypothetical protein